MASSLLFHAAAPLIVSGYIRCFQLNTSHAYAPFVLDSIVAFCVGKQDIKLIFLDVDGVLNTQWSSGLQNDLIQNLAQIIHETDCKIILSSTWRLQQIYKDKLLTALQETGNIDIAGVYIGDTPLIDNGLVRAMEIESCLASMRMVYNVTAWCAIDDTNLQDPALMHSDLTRRIQTKRKCKQLMSGHFVQTSASMGLVAAKSYQVIRILTVSDSVLGVLEE